ncbi:MAG: 2-amino-4-hydroxy-6-hydroxymethyldihydropteridine diphosphokinase [Nitriliruptorales bacterium]|nr:2-amino-4-hydroxy-6-hydroxymethyldihydropteridine diphosphokinase [Nitriliruptorales bacterium]
MSAVAAYLSLGSNLGDRLDTLMSAVFSLDETDAVAVEETSGIYETEPWGGVEQPSFYNLAVRIRTTLAPRELLGEVQLTERAMGRDRDREERWGPRTLDIDILLYGDEQLDEPDLTIPHPRMTERAFVLVPLLEIMPGGELPDGSRLTAHLQRLMPIEGVELVVRVDELPSASRVPRPEGPNAPGAYFADEPDRP